MTYAVSQVKTTPKSDYYPSIYKNGSSSQYVVSLFLVSALALLHLFFTYMHHPAPISDEVFHKPMVEAMARLDYANRPRNVTTPPIFHAVIGFVEKAVNLKEHSLQVMRLIQLVISAMAIPCFYYIRRHIAPEGSDVRALICLFLPIYLPFMGLLYTDPPAVAFFVLTVVFMLRGQNWAAASVATIGVGIRQVNIIWTCFCACYVLIQGFERNMVFGTDLGKWKRWSTYLDIGKEVIPYLLPAAVFVAYSIYNGGMVSGDTSAHKVGLNFSNLFMFLIVSFFLLLPINIERAHSTYKMVMSSRWWLFVIVGIFLSYMHLYKITHGYNHIYPHWFLHNMLLKASTTIPVYKLLFAIPVIWMVLTFTNVALQSDKKWQFFLIYAFALLSFLPLPMGAIRYYIIALLVFLLWCPKLHKYTEYSLLGGFVLASYILIYGQSKHYFFIS